MRAERAFILASGKSSRMRESDGQDIAKPIRRVGGKFLISYVIDALMHVGVSEIYIVHYPPDGLPERVDPDMTRLHWIADHRQIGSLYAFSLIEPFVSYPFICTDSDIICSKDDFSYMINEGLRSIERNAFNGTIAVLENPSFQ